MKNIPLDTPIQVIRSPEHDDWFSVSRNFILNEKFSPGARMLSLVLDAQIGQDGSKTFKLDSLCQVLGADKETINKWAQELAEANLIQIN